MRPGVYITEVANVMGANVPVEAIIVRHENNVMYSRMIVPPELAVVEMARGRLTVAEIMFDACLN
jgi:hypothetical protein